MQRLLLDHQGAVVASGAGVAGAAWPDWLQGVAAGVSLTALLDERARGGHIVAQAVHLGLQAVLARRQPLFEHRSLDQTVRIEALSPLAPVSVLVSLGTDDVPQGELDRMRASLVTAERRLAAVQSAAQLGSWYVDLSRRLAVYDPETYRLLRRDPALGPLPADELRSRAHPDDLPVMLAARERVYAGEANVCTRFRLRCDDGVLRWFETRITLEPERLGRPRSVIGTVRDVSDLMAAQLELERHRERLENLVVSRTVQLAEASQRAEAAGRARDDFLSQAGHELRTPLNVIVSLAHLVRRGMPDAATSARVQAIELAARQLGAVVDQALEEADGPRRERVALCPVDPAALLGGVAASLAPVAQARELRLHVAVEPSPWALSGDVDRLRRLCAAAAGWACAAAQRGTVTLGSRVGTPEGGQAPLELRVSARMGALPRNPDDHPDLAALQYLTRQLGGSVAYRHDDDGIAHVTVEVPLAARATAPQAAPGAAPPSAVALRERHRDRRVLLAEDDPVNQLALLELLADVGLQVDVADDGRAAVDQAALRPYDLVLLDLRMPRLDGWAAARAMRALPVHQRTPIVAITANTFDEDRDACLAAGMDDFLGKPIEVSRLYDTLLRWLDRSAAPRPPAEQRPVAAPPPPAPPRDPAMASLLRLEGVDALGGLASVGGKIEVYRRLLGIFAVTHAADGMRLQQALERGDQGSVGALMHRIRGSAATLGLVDVETAAAALEHAADGAAPPADGPLARDFVEALAGTVERLRHALDA
ncbi:MAG: response regulator [Rubrivivax sp.]